MTKQDRQKFSILVVLLAVLGLTLVLGYRMNRPPTTAVAQPPETPKTSAKPLTSDNARIHLDDLEKGTGDEDIGRKNVFQYGPIKPPPPPPGPPRGTSAVLNPPPPGLGQRIGPPPGPVSPPPPPPVPLKYQGFATTKTPTGRMTAFLSDDTRHYNVTVGEILMGRYRIVSITDKTVEIEDLEFNRRQMLPLLK